MPDKRNIDTVSTEEERDLKKVHFENVESKEEDEYDPAPATHLPTSTIIIETDNISKLTEFEENRNYSYKEWQIILSKIITEGNTEKIDKAFNKYFSQYVNDGDQWCKYIESKMKDVSTIDKPLIEGLFSKVLTKIYNIKLWRLYLKYVEIINPITPDNSERARSIVLKAFNFAIETVGIDFFQSHELWKDYLKYLYMWQTVTPNEASTREDLIRKALRKMISYPNVNLEDNWETFVKFEEDINLNKSRKIFNETTEEFLKIKKINEELIKITKSIKKLDDRRYSSRQLKRWNEWILWEKKNKMNLNENELNKRIEYVYKSSLEYCGLIPEVWFNYSNYLILDKGKDKNGAEILNDGIKVNPCSLILRYQLSNYYEKNMIDNSHDNSSIEKIKSIWLELIKNIEDSNNTNNQIKNKDRLITYCYSLLMRIIKRISNMKEVRIIFKLARQYKSIDWIIFYQYAMIEYHNKEIKIASRTFSLGMQYFSKKIKFIVKYLEFLININDMTTFKTVIEVSINENFKDDKKALKILFKKYFEIEQTFGDIQSINNLTKRYMKTFNQDSAIELINVGLKSNEDEFNCIKELDEYGNGFRVENDMYEKLQDVETVGEDDINISDVIDELNDNTNGGNKNYNNNKGGEADDIKAKLYSFLQALPQDAQYQEQIKDLSIGKIFDYFRNVEK